MSIRSADDALLYLIDCTLATVAHMAYLKSRPSGEFKRQISIAQKGLTWVRELGIEPTSRANDVANHYEWDVAKWADAMVARSKSFTPKVRP